MEQLDTEKEAARIQHAYSYIRLSSKKQLKGTGEHRQATRAEDICKEKGWKLSPKTFQDLGVSAFTGKNLLTGALSEFIRLADAGSLAPNPVLIIEAWDRFSRQDIDVADNAALALLKAGVAIHIAFGNRTFTRASAKAIGARIEILVAMKAAFDYSANLSRRVRSAKARKVAKIAEGGTANVREMAPRWLDWDAKQQKFKLNAKAPLVAEAFRKYNSGASIVSIVREFNESGTPAMRGGKWHTASVRFILGSKATYGDFKGVQFFPAVVSKQDFDRAQVLLDKNRNRRGHSAQLVNLFRGLVFCSECGFAVTMTKNSRRNYAYYRCSYSARGACSQRWLCRANQLEEDFFVFMLQKHPEIVARKDNHAAHQTLDSLRAQKLENEESRKRILDLLTKSNDALAAAKYAELSTAAEELDRKIAEAANAVAQDEELPKALGNLEQLVAGDDDVKLDNFMRSLQRSLGDRETRQRLATVIGSIVKRIDLNFSTLDVRTTFVNGTVNEHQIIH